MKTRQTYQSITARHARETRKARALTIAGSTALFVLILWGAFVAVESLPAAADETLTCEQEDPPAPCKTAGSIFHDGGER